MGVGVETKQVESAGRGRMMKGEGRMDGRGDKVRSGRERLSNRQNRVGRRRIRIRQAQQAHTHTHTHRRGEAAGIGTLSARQGQAARGKHWLGSMSMVQRGSRSRCRVEPPNGAERLRADAAWAAQARPGRKC